MALLKPMTVDGKEVSYHAIRHVSLRYTERARFFVVVASWPDEESRRKGQDPMCGRFFTDLLEQEVTRADLYAFLKTRAEFGDARDA